jgi:anti-sigma B factor antagonist
MEAGMQDLELETLGPYGDCAVLRVSGEIDLYTAPLLRERIADLVAAGIRHVVLDASDVTFLDSTGLGVLVGGLKRLRAHGGSLALAGSRANVARIFNVTGLDRPFPQHATVAEAIAASPHWRGVQHEPA